MWYLTLCTDTCDFEESNICGYTQDKTDDFDWTRDNGGTTTRGTGPSADHTYGTKEGTSTLYTCEMSSQLLQAKNFQKISIKFGLINRCFLIVGIVLYLHLPLGP